MEVGLKSVGVQGRGAGPAAFSWKAGGSPPSAKRQPQAKPRLQGVQLANTKTNMKPTSGSMKGSLMLLAVVGCAAAFGVAAAAADGAAFQCGAPYAACGESLPAGVTCEEKGM